MYGGIQARLLTVLTSPGTATRAAPRGTGFLCIEDPDPAAANIKNLLEHAGVRPVDMVPWNACPWFTREQKPTTAELEAGVDPWLRLMALVPALRVIMLLGGAAEKGWRRVLLRRPDLASCPDIAIISTYSPGRALSGTQIPQSARLGNKTSASPSGRLRRRSGSQTRRSTHLRPSGHIMPDHAGDRGAAWMVLAPHDHLHIKQTGRHSDGAARHS
jgi:hypothetical protein